MEKQFVTWEQTETFIRQLDEHFKNDIFDCVLAIARGGAILGTLFSHYRDIPVRYACISSYKNSDKVTEPIFKQHAEINGYKNILVIDDIIDTGETINAIKNTIEANSTNKKFTYVTMYAVKDHINDIDYYYQLKDSKWIEFCWEQTKKD